MSQGSLNPKIRFLGQKVCPAARIRTDEQTDRHTHTHTHETTEGTLSGFQEFFLQPIIKDRPTCGTISGLHILQKDKNTLPSSPSQQNILLKKIPFLHSSWKKSILFSWKNLLFAFILKKVLFYIEIIPFFAFILKKLIFHPFFFFFFSTIITWKNILFAETVAEIRWGFGDHYVNW